jgi:hypothetical protein
MKQMRTVLILAILIVLIAGPVLATNTVNSTGGRQVLQVSAMDSDFNMVAQTGYTQYADGGVPIVVILFYPGAADDILVVKQQSASGPIITKLKSTDGEPRVMPLYGSRVKPYIDYSECTLSSGAFVVFIVEIK